ncbi:hypothetical protein So717_04090 [Roseobacter cerasinus]|uniref:Lipoprotein n=1 Tax=Roseobacter cerasinus TaxID=2602289 RepID=A0A640VR16_9RHOB|nr:hypothetical protein [Roseobacter cerasinus]GFE48656.1 hypothetical protein So717_04090 [Roseobacter cerasinus]
MNRIANRISKPSLFAASICIVLAACSNETPSVSGSEADSRRIAALCGGGFSDSTKASLAAVIEKAKASGEISAEVERDLRTALLSSPAVTEKNIVELYNLFLGCVREQTGL